MILEEKKPCLSVLLPSYNNAATILETIKSILNQSFKDFELLISDDQSTDQTVDLIRSVHDERIKFYVNEKNLGCGGNLNACLNLASADILVYVCGDDILDVAALEKIYKAFQISEEIGTVVRPYYWFEEDYRKPVRVTKQFDKTKVVSINSPFGQVKDVVALADQLSGIGFRRKHIVGHFEVNPFVETASMVVKMLKQSSSVILKDNIVAVRIGFSNSRNCSVYQKSPMLSWANMINKVLIEEKFKKLKKYLIRNFIARNYIGLVQIKNYGGFKFLLREIWYLLKFRWQNIFNIRFWFFSLGTIIVPSVILRKLVVGYKNVFNSRFLKNLSINNNF
ncbi:TPA: hypothetical protein DCZ15_01320 [Candidatus Falkowbacteria bacterium]|nr:MAG: Glycosyl transferase, family 2 [Candidatus Falkowbacteria bacterium GW2011_GWF2_43_32]HBA36495.1 hypothetical protein [Candidatus Falkowbacteria bacterium]